MMRYIRFNDMAAKAGDQEVTVNPDAIEYLMPAPNGPTQTRVQLRGGRQLLVLGSVDSVLAQLGERSDGRPAVRSV